MAGAAARHDLAAGDADVHVKLTAKLAAQIRHGGADRERGAHRSLRVVAVGDRSAEHRHGTVANVLVDGAAEPLDQAIDEAEEAIGHVVHRLGAELVGQAGVPGQVTEQHAHLPPLAFSDFWRRRRNEPMTAGGAELMIGLDGAAACRATLRQPGATPGTEPSALWTVEAAAGAAHP